MPRNRDRARVVCVQCHARKVKCDLEDQAPGACRNCVRHCQVCQPRDGIRPIAGQKRTLDEAVPDPVSSQLFPLNGNLVATNSQYPNSSGPLPRTDETQSKEHGNHDSTNSYQLGYVGEQSLMTWQPTPASHLDSELGAFTKEVSEQILRVTGAASLPPEVMIEASADMYFKRLFHRIPVLDRRDINFANPSPLLLQALGLVGSILRHPQGSSSLSTSERYYVKVKTLLNYGPEQDPLNRLKALCLVGLWHIRPPTDLGSDTGWHWVGIAVRQLLQMGLHRESTYAKMPQPGIARRIAWTVFIQDKFVATSTGRPVGICSHDFDIRPTGVRDFEVMDEQAEVFIEYAKLGSNLGRMLELASGSPEPLAEEAMVILNSLKSWIHELPAHLHLYSANYTKIYRPAIYEAHLCYFACIITFFHVCGHAIRSATTSLASLVASSCIARLSEELYYRDDINYLTAINNWYLMVGCAPLIHYEGSPLDSDGMCKEELDILITVMKQMQIKWPQTACLLKTVDRLRRSKGDGGSASLSHAFVPAGALGERDHLTMSFLKDLFPFPHSMCSRMKLFDSAPSVERNRPTMQTRIPDNSDNFDWIFDEWFEVSRGG